MVLLLHSACIERLGCGALGACVACADMFRLGPVETLGACCGTKPGTSFPDKAGGGIPGPDWRHQDVDTIRAYGPFLMISTWDHEKLQRGASEVGGMARHFNPGSFSSLRLFGEGPLTELPPP